MPTVAAPLLSSIILTIVFVLMWRTYRERWLGLWATASALWMARYGLALVIGDYHYLPGARLLPLIALGRGTFLLLGAYALVGRRLPRPWLYLFGADLGLLIAEWATHDLVLFGAPGVPHYALFGVATIWSAAIVYGQRRPLGGAAVLVSCGLAAIGMSNATFPWTSRLPEAIVPIFFMLAHAAQLGVGFGAIMIFYARAKAERDAAQVKLEAALAKALTGYLPICAHCKAIRGEDGEWESLERYFSQRIDAAFSHGICDSCAEHHYGVRKEDAPSLAS